MFMLYIDPGTGSMLLSLFIGIATAAVFGIRALFIKLQFVLSRGKIDKNAEIKNIPYVIFSDHKRYWNVFKPICDEFEKRCVDLVYYTCSPDDPVLTAEYKYVKSEFIGEGNKAFAKLNYLHADILIATTPNLEVYQWKRSKNVKYYVHIPHSISDFAGYRMFALDYYDIVLASGQNQLKSMRQIEELRPSIKRKEFIVAGSTYLDSMKTRLQNIESKKENNKKVVLVAPTWGKSGILSKFGEKFLNALSKTEFEIIVRPHPQSVSSEKDMLKTLESKFPDFNWNYDNDNFEVLNKADIMITDFSGVIFDFSLIFDKPIIYTDTKFDSLPYDADWLDEPLWEFTILSKLGLKLDESNFDKIGEIINDAFESKELQQGRDFVRNEAWNNQQKSAQTVADYLTSLSLSIKTE